MSLARSAVLAERDVADQVDELAEPLLVEAGAGVVLGQHALERRVVALDGDHRVVDERADGRAAARSPCRCDQRASGGTQKMLAARYSSGSSGSAPCAFCASSSACLRLEGVGDVLEEDQAEDDVLVLGRVHVVAQRVGRLPEPRFEAELSRAVLCVLVCSCHEMVAVFVGALRQMAL